MQLFYLLPFVVVASHAAALPQPAGLSEQYSSNVDITLASFFETRSYQHVLNTQEDSATLMSLERRVDSGGASGGNSGGSGPPSPPLLTPEDVKDIIASFFKDNDFSSANISSTIDRVQDGIVGFYKDGEKAKKEIGGTAGAMLKRYLERSIYVIVALIDWMEKEAMAILRATRSVVGATKFREIFRAFIAARAESAKLADKKEREVTGAVLNILAKTGTVIENVNTIHTSFGDLFNNRIALFTLLGSPLKDFEATKVLYGYISNAVTSLTKFLADQQNIHDGIIKALEPPPPK
ncbi:hypothetical protein BASA50_004215 [Batrachochytrium salamandrivorans]|uniref:Uncharacterized protein n=1 Tax=Batrachochytrium salamandrivorans TaxID=1357716 RepID=A0ABQ8FJ90_9FUNG|nr:hypothetical protein BASA60_009954 [Batrachochytrium salamandrivorans]KAH6597872.1 hypothetical protein BASA50_004215 [Batrachochytrium salamandrivorans]